MSHIRLRKSAAALNADFQTLDRLQFDKIHIQLAEVGGTEKPSIEIEKSPQHKLPFYSVRGSAEIRVKIGTSVKQLVQQPSIYLLF